METQSGNSKLMSTINVTPLVDVMLVLLVIFMVTSPMMIQSIDVNLPETKTAVAKTSEDPVTLTIDKGGVIYIDDKKLEKSNMKSFLENLFKYRRNKEVIVRADKSVPYGNVIELLDMLREIGITKIGMVTRSKE
jgi:biopolymer transport protein TolR